MTHLPIRTLEDGTRIYSNGARYTPVPDAERKYLRHKVAGAQEVGAPLPGLLPEDAREMPGSVTICKRRDSQE